MPLACGRQRGAGLARLVGTLDQDDPGRPYGRAPDEAASPPIPGPDDDVAGCVLMIVDPRSPSDTGAPGSICAKKVFPNE